jgi:hypothetical protein
LILSSLTALKIAHLSSLEECAKSIREIFALELFAYNSNFNSQKLAPGGGCQPLYNRD